jgi:hypothetical protein
MHSLRKTEITYVLFSSIFFEVHMGPLKLKLSNTHMEHGGAR